MRSVRVNVPASTANLGPAFDVLALAVCLRNVVELRCTRLVRFRSEKQTRLVLRRTALTVVIRGEGGESLPLDRRCLVWKAASRMFVRCRAAPDAAALCLTNRIPLARGLGSSAAAIVGGLVATNALCGGRISKEEIFRIAAELEGHPDNVAAALFGGLTACIPTKEGPRAFRLPLSNAYRCVFAVPEFKLLTAHARRCVPDRMRRDDVVFSMSRAVTLAGLLARGDTRELAEMMRDRLHQPYRARLIPGLDDVIEAALRAGALGAALSGAGSTVLALVPRKDRRVAARAGDAMVTAFERAGVRARCLVRRIDHQGARVQKVK